MIKTESWQDIYKRYPLLKQALKLRLTDYIPHSPTPKQRIFLGLNCLEALYGGAAGGGKSDALLMGALQYADIPHYAAIIFRRTFRDLSLPESLIPRSQEWLQPTDARWNSQQYEWHFPSGAVLAFGYLDSINDKYRYMSSAYQYIGFDEVTQFREEDFTYLFSRLRRTRNIPVPLRMRLATNPGGTGGPWVKDRYQIKKVYSPESPDGRFFGLHPNRVYIPAGLEDNPHLDDETYRTSLAELDPITREQLLAGNWDVTADGRFRRKWVQYYSRNGDYIILGRDRRGEAVHLTECEIFMAVDSASTKKDHVATTKKMPSWTVIGTFARTRAHNHLIWLDNQRFQDEVPVVLRRIAGAYEKWKSWPNFTTICIESANTGIGVFQQLRDFGLPMQPLATLSQDKVIRSADAQNRMEQGQIWFPQTAPWLDILEGEVFTWTGDPNETDDQIDVLAYAARHVSSRQRGSRESPSVVGSLTKRL